MFAPSSFSAPAAAKWRCRPTSFLAAAVLALAVFSGAPQGAAAQSDEPECPQIDLSNIGVIAEPCADPTMACDLTDGCMGAVIGFIEQQLDFSQFSEIPSQEYITGEVCFPVSFYADTHTRSFV